MIRGGVLLLAGASLGLAACAANRNLQVRAIPDPSAKLRFSGGLLAEGRAQLALGNAGTALETFRKLLREQPTSPDAFAGIAACYHAMGRFDLERSNYEYALAYAPGDRQLLGALASTLERLGERENAALVRALVANAAPRPAKPIHSITVSVAAAPEPVRSAEATPAAMPQPVRTAESTPAPRPVAVHTEPTPVATPARVHAAEAAPAVVPLPVRNAEATAPAIPVPHMGSVTVDLPPARPVMQAEAPQLPEVAPFVYAAMETPPAPTVTLPVPPPPAPPEQPPKAEKVSPGNAEAGHGPYLERLSTGEVALVTTSEPIWRSQAAQLLALVERSRSKPRPMPAPKPISEAAVRWIPLRGSNPGPNVRLLNAARSQGLAAWSRQALLQKGWRKIDIGDAPQVRRQSVVLYPASRTALGQRVASAFGFKAVRDERAQFVTILLGKDAAWRKAARSRA